MLKSHNVAFSFLVAGLQMKKIGVDVPFMQVADAGSLPCNCPGQRRKTKDGVLKLPAQCNLLIR